jgi:hypothetical protein
MVYNYPDVIASLREAISKGDRDCFAKCARNDD